MSYVVNYRWFKSLLIISCVVSAFKSLNFELYNKEKNLHQIILLYINVFAYPSFAFTSLTSAIYKYQPFLFRNYCLPKKAMCLVSETVVSTSLNKEMSLQNIINSNPGSLGSMITFCRLNDAINSLSSHF